MAPIQWTPTQYGNMKNNCHCTHYSDCPQAWLAERDSGGPATARKPTGKAAAVHTVTRTHIEFVIHTQTDQ